MTREPDVMTIPADQPPTGFPEWLSPSLPKAGRDPLGLQTITEDRITPVLLPGVLALSRRARYFSIYPFLLDEYRRANGRAASAALDAFVKRREFEYAVAVELCPRCRSEGAGANGARQARAALGELGDAPIDRRESVESHLGGYGLYYRSPLIDLGVVAPQGTLMRQTETPIPIDVLFANGPGPKLAEAFRAAVDETAYYREHFHGTGRIPQTLLAEYAEAACLCRLEDHPHERELLRNLFFVGDDAAVDQRRRTFALFLTTLAADPAAFADDVAFRRVVIDAFDRAPASGDPRSVTVAQWAALVMKEYVQEALSILWIEFLTLGLRRAGTGSTSAELHRFVSEELLGPGHVPLGDGLPLPGALPTREAIEAIRAATAGVDRETLLRWALHHRSALSGLVLFIATIDALPAEPPDAFARIAASRSERQPSLLGFRALFEQHLDAEPTVAETLAFLTGRFVIQAHELVAYSKLPEFTFRFRWEGGRLVFYDNGVERFEPSGNRREAIARISEDIGYCRSEAGSAAVTADGDAFVEAVFA